MRPFWLIVVALPLMAASPHRQFTLAVPAEGTLTLPTGQQAFSSRRPAYEPAPLPNRDLAAPRAPARPAESSLSPTLFTQREQFRGDGFSAGSSPQNEQERRLRPAAGFSLHMPLQPQ